MIDLPEGVEISEISATVLNALEEYTVLAWAVLKTQCRSMGMDPTSLTPAQLEALIPRLTRSVARFSSPAKASALEAGLRGVVAAYQRDGDG